MRLGADAIVLGSLVAARLDALLAESDPKLAGELLRQHGPITAEEVPYLAQKAETGRAVVRANAARYLGLARAPEAVVALRGLLGACFYND